MEKTEIYYGSIFWLLEGLKVVNKEFNFDKKSNKLQLKDRLPNINSTTSKNRKYTSFEYNTHNKQLNTVDVKHCSDYNGFFFYECIIFNEEKEDSLLFQEGKDLYEYFSNDRCELILKLLKIYSQKYLLSNRHDNANNAIKHKEIVNRDKYNKMLQYSLSQTELICEKIYSNIFLQYKDGSVKWLNNYEIKRLLFNFKFLPNYTKIRILKLFPLSIDSKELSSLNQCFTFTDTEDKLGKSQEEIDYDMFCAHIKKIFFDKYGLNLKKLETDAVKINGVFYIIEVKELKFEKFDSKFVQLKCERLLRNFRNNYKYYNLEVNKQQTNIKDIDNLLNTMLDTYNGLCEVNNVHKYLSLPPKDIHSDETFKVLKPKAPMLLSEMIDDKISPKVFAHYCSNKKYKNY